MSETHQAEIVNETETKTSDTKDTPATLVDAVFDLGLTWAAYGLKVAKDALEASGKTLDTTAKALERLAEELAKKEPKPENEQKAA